ncbi:MAG: hypothetical protein H7A36_07020 [Chlamydiales bacterium]|nr:hypothetical protein [Chlamydiales bacterium]
MSYAVAAVAIALLALSICIGMRVGALRGAHTWQAITTTFGGLVLMVAAALLCPEKGKGSSSEKPQKQKRAKSAVSPVTQVLHRNEADGVTNILYRHEADGVTFEWIGEAALDRSRLPENTFVLNAQGLHSKERTIPLVEEALGKGVCVVERFGLTGTRYFLVIDGESKGCLFCDGIRGPESEPAVIAELPQIFAAIDTERLL